MLAAMSGLVWVELDEAAPDHNLRELRKCASPDAKLCAVVKSNAYGHGLEKMVGLLASAEWLGVNSLEEGVKVRQLGETRPVLVMGHVPLADLGEAVGRGLDLTLYNLESLAALAKISASLPTNSASMPTNSASGSQPPASAARPPIRVHLKIETGTGRQGILPGEIPSFAHQLASIPGAELVGACTHYANIEDTLNHEYAERQIERFRQALDLLEKLGLKPPLPHTACTAAGILFPETHYALLRVGIGLYGLWPSRETYLSALMGRRPVPDLRPVLSWKTRIVQLKLLPEGSFVGYGCTFKTTRATRLAVLPVGYADGYDRALGNTAHVLVHGKRAPVIGRVCMNLTMADVTDIPQARLEDEVVLLGKSGDEQVSAETLASWAGTINYEIVSRISPLLERRIVRAGS
jgi:alanine racemase